MLASTKILKTNQSPVWKYFCCIPSPLCMRSHPLRGMKHVPYSIDSCFHFSFKTVFLWIMEIWKALIAKTTLKNSYSNLIYVMTRGNDKGIRHMKQLVSLCHQCPHQHQKKLDHICHFSSTITAAKATHFGIPSGPSTVLSETTICSFNFISVC